MTDAPPIAVLFVCLGNICRSPSAHGVFRARVAAAGLRDRIRIDSAGTGDWHVGKPPDARATAAAAERDIDLSDLRARQVCADDLRCFDDVIVMDYDNLHSLRALAARTDKASARITLFGDFSRRYRGEPVPDPYFGGEDGFQRALDMIEDASEGLLAELRVRLTESH